MAFPGMEAMLVCINTSATRVSTTMRAPRMIFGDPSGCVHAVQSEAWQAVRTLYTG